MENFYDIAFYYLFYLCSLNIIILLLFQKNEDFPIRKQLVCKIIEEKGQELVRNLIHASAFCLHTYMLTDVADVLMELCLLDKEVKLIIL